MREGTVHKGKIQDVFEMQRFFVDEFERTIFYCSLVNTSFGRHSSIL